MSVVKKNEELLFLPLLRSFLAALFLSSLGPREALDHSPALRGVLELGYLLLGLEREAFFRETTMASRASAAGDVSFARRNFLSLSLSLSLLSHNTNTLQQLSSDPR